MMLETPTQPAHYGLQPSRLWSFWDMAINLQLFGFVHLYGLMQQEEQLAERDLNLHEANKASPQGKLLAIPPFAVASSDSMERVKGLFAYAHQLAKQLELDAVADRVERFQVKLRAKKPLHLTELQAEIRVLRETFEDGFRFKYFYLYPRDRVQQVLLLESDWAPTIKAFPSARAEIMDAVDCYGLDKCTASVFHLMRVAEYGLRALARERRVRLPKGKPLEWGTWQDLIKGVKAEAETIGKTKKAGARKDAALDFYNGAVAHFDGFKDQFRNVVMHVRKRYDSREADQALHQVRVFMNELSRMIGDETKGPIKWKF